MKVFALKHTLYSGWAILSSTHIGLIEHNKDYFK